MTPAEIRAYLPFIGHINPDTCLMTRGRRFAVLHHLGRASELADARQIVADKLAANRLYTSIETPRVAIWDFFIRQDRQAMRHLPRIGNWFGARFDDAWREAHGRSLYRNDLFTAVILHAEHSIGGALRWLSKRDNSDLQAAAQSEFEDLMGRIQVALRRYGARRLGIREGGVAGFSEPFEALHLIANNRYRPIGLSDDWMGPAIVPERLAFDDRELRILGEDGPHYIAILSPLTWPASTDPLMLDTFRVAPAGVTYGLTIAQSWMPTPSHAALGHLTNAVKAFKASDDAAKSQAAELEQDLNDVAAKRSIRGSSHFTIAVHARSHQELDRAVADAQDRAANEGITLVRETDGLKAAFYSQLCNKQWRTRPAPIKSVNAVSLSAKNNVPRGRDRSRWGAPVIMLRTTADTEYGFHFHVQGSAQIPAEDLASTLLCGPSGSGKTALLAGVSLLALRNPLMRVVVIDKGCGLSVMVRAAGGRYLVLPYGEPSGMAPLRGLPDTETNRQFLVRFLRALILSDGKGDIASAEDAALARAVAFQLSMAPEERSIAQVATMLGGRRKPESASARLRKWCRGERLGWVFDGERDDIDLQGRIMGFDAGAFLKDPEVTGPILAYLFYRIGELLNGDPILLVVDEAWQLDAIRESREQIKEYLKTVRKREGAVLLATQSAGDALNSAIADDFRQQIPTKIFFADDTATEAQLVGGMGLTAPEYKTVTQELPNKPFTFLLHRPGGSVLCKYDLSFDKGKVAVLSARDSTYRLMCQLIARYGDDPECWVPEFERLAPGIVDEPTERPTITMLEAAE